MLAITIREPGAPEVLTPFDCPAPEAGSGELLIRVEAAGVNRPDVLQRRGLYAPPPGASPLPGLEVAGRVIEAGRIRPVIHQVLPLREAAAAHAALEEGIHVGKIVLAVGPDAGVHPG